MTEKKGKRGWRDKVYEYKFTHVLKELREKQREYVCGAQGRKKEGKEKRRDYEVHIAWA